MKSFKMWMFIFVTVAIVATISTPSPVNAQNGYPQLTNFVVVRSQAIPTSLTDVIKQNAYVCYADFAATGQNVLVQDRQATPIVWINGVLGASMASTTWFFTPILPNGCRPMPNGISIQAGGAGVTGTMIIGCPTRCVLTWGF